MKRLRFTVTVTAILAVCALPAVGLDSVISVRAGLPTDVFINLGLGSIGQYDVYAYGASAEVSLELPVTRRLLAGGLAGYGFGKTEPDWDFEIQHYIWGAGTIGYGTAEDWSVSLVIGAVYMPDKDPLIIPDLGLACSWGPVSLVASTAMLGIGARF